MKRTLTAAALSLGLMGAAFSSAVAAPVKYTLDESHSQVVFSYDHLGYSTTYGMFSGFGGEIMFDQENPANSSVSVSIAADTILTGWTARDDHFKNEDFFDVTNNNVVTFTSTAIEVTGKDTALITGDLTINGVTKSVVLDAKLNQVGEHPMANKQWAGFDATTTLVRSDFDLGMFTPFVGDEVALIISVEAQVAE